MQENREHQSFHVGLKAFVADKDKLLILQDDEGFWELPGGRIEKGEIHKDLKDILTRELTEEIGENIRYTIGSIFHSWIRKIEHEEYVDVVYAESDLCISLVGFYCIFQSGTVTLSHEHQNYKWITKDQVNTLEFENTYKEAVQFYFKSLES